MNEEQLTKLLNEQLGKFFGHMNQRFDELSAELRGEIAGVRHDLDGVRNVVDAIHARLDDGDTERLAMSAQLDRHDRWFKQLSDHGGVKLNCEA